MKQVTIAFKGDVAKSTFVTNTMHYNDVLAINISEGMLLIRVRFGIKQHVDHHFPIENILVITESPAPEVDGADSPF